MSKLGPKAAYAKQAICDKLIGHRQYIHEHGEDLPEIRNWTWETGEVEARPAWPPGRE